ncbi:MAG: site-specific integrase [Oscillospiraceae bacterium]|nr:site-specific integrase [Oscillospiraceae bacterium]
MPAKKRRDAGSGTIRQRKDGMWEGRYTVGYHPETGKQLTRSVYAKTKREVRDKLNKTLTEIKEGTYLEPTTMTVGQWLDTWLKEYKINIRPETKASYEMHIRIHLKPDLGRIRLNKLTTHQIQLLYNKLINERGLSPKTVKNVHGALHAALEQAKINGYLRINPSEGTTLPKIEKEEVKTMDIDDVSAFLQAIKGDPYELPLFVDLFTGLRQGELLGLTWDCVDFEKGTLLINKQHNRAKGEKEYHFSPLKNSRPRCLTPASAVMDALREQKKRQQEWAEAAGSAWDNRENLVFTTELGRYINNKTLWMNFKRIAKELGMEELRFHDLRHTFSVNSLQAGDDIKTVQENLGHATAAFTLSTYAHATPGMKRESANRMDAFIRTVRESSETQAPKTNA